MIPPADYIDLRRSFAPLPAGLTAEDSAIQNYSSGSNRIFSRPLSWDDLLEYPLVVLLGEPGSGKTFELRHQATLSSPKGPRFYLRLDELAAAGENFRLSGDDFHRLAAWQKSSNIAIFFLDSVDEAKIRHSADFYRALDRFVEVIGRRAVSQARIIISSRITEWLPIADGHELRVRFPKVFAPFANTETKSEEGGHYPFVVQMLPLDEAAVTIYAAARGVEDAQKFLDALDRAHAWELARRPADVNDLLAFWRETGNLGTLSEILSFVCDSQLRKTSDRERIEVLALERARSGAEFLAAATIFCRRFIFEIPGETSLGSHGLEALACLPPDWRNEEAKALLNHALFDGASHGHIRFHHRRLSEFLAARWIQRLMAQGCPVNELEDLLFDVRGSDIALRPSLAPLAAWLCPGAARWNQVVCSHVIEVAPEILLRYGDPEALAVEDRRALLRSICKKADGRQHLWWERDQATLSRLSSDMLVEEVNQLITAPSSGQSLKELGLEIVIAGKLMLCAPTVVSLAVADLTLGRIFPTAVRALKSVGGEPELRALADAAREIAQFPERVCVPLCSLLFPRIWSVSELFRNLIKTMYGRRLGMGWDYMLCECLSSGVNKENSVSLLSGLLGHSLGCDDEFELPTNLKGALAVLGVMLDWPDLSDDEVSLMAQVLVQLDGRPPIGEDDSIPKRTQRHLDLREQYFRLAEERLIRDGEIADVSMVTIMIFYDWIKPDSSDLRWILPWLRAARSQDDRRKALRWGLEVWQHTGRNRDDLIQLRRLAKLFPETRKLFFRYFHPGFVVRVKMIYHRKIRYQFRRYRIRSILVKFRKLYQRLSNAWNLFRHRERIRSGDYVGWLASLALEARGKAAEQWSPTDWSKLVRRRGARCAEAAKQGCQRVWLNYEPLLPHEVEPGEQVTVGTIAGLAGIQVAWQEGKLSFEKLSFDDARRATRYALNELNGFAPWFDELVRAQPLAVRSILVECINYEWRIPTESGHHHLALYDLAWAESDAGHLIKPTLMELLSDDEPRNFNVLRYALCILAEEPSPAFADLAFLAEERCRSVEVHSESFAQWMALWLQADALPAIQELESRLRATVNFDHAETVVSICANLSIRSGYRLPFLKDPSWLNPSAMRRFIPFVYYYVRPEDDIDRLGGGAYSPIARDHAQEFRSALLQMLMASKNLEARVVLTELLSEPILAHLSDYMRHLLEMHREQMAEGPMWRSSDVRKFSFEYEREPQTDADLFRLGIRRLADLKRWVEFGEDSPRKEVHQSDQEAGFRDWLRRKLNERSRGYVVPPEWEIVGGRPDLRLVMSGAAPVSLELKIADNWSLQELVDGLETQLVGTYLRDDRARYGIYVLALYDQDRKWRSLSSSSKISYEQMVQIIQQRIDAILKTRVDIAGLEVVLINFASPA